MPVQSKMGGGDAVSSAVSRISWTPHLQSIQSTQSSLATLDAAYLRDGMSVHLISFYDVFWSILLLFSGVIFVRRLSTLSVRIPPKTRSVSIIVLGDIGRSPRTMYHAESFAKAGFNTFIVGYKGPCPALPDSHAPIMLTARAPGTKPPPSLLTAPGIRFLYLPPPPKVSKKLFLILGPYKLLHQCVGLMYGLWKGLSKHRPPQFVMVQVSALSLF